MFILEVVLIKIYFPFGTDDNHRVVLKSISGGVDCEHDYINAAYVDVSFLRFLANENLLTSIPLHIIVSDTQGYSQDKKYIATQGKLHRTCILALQLKF